MQIANVMVALGGNRDMTVPKYGVTASEIQVLRAIHGNEAVFDIEPIGEIKRADREEIGRLADPLNGYGKARIGDKSVVETLFPGGPLARTFKTIDELGIDEEFFKPLTRVKADAKPDKKSKKVAEPVPEGEGTLFDGE